MFALIALWAFLTPINALPLAPVFTDYVWPIAIFAVLDVPLASTLPNHGSEIAISAIIFGTCVELAQPSFGRGFEAGGLLSNMIGSGIGWVFAQRLRAILKLA